MANSTSNSAARKPGRPSTKPKAFRPPKPYKSFPLTAQSGGYWMKKVRGKIYYFGRWAKRTNGKLERLPNDGWEEALKLYEAQASDLHSGRVPVEEEEPKAGQLLLCELCDYFLQSKQKKYRAGKLTLGTFTDYKRACDMLIGVLGKNKKVSRIKPYDFSNVMAALEERFGLVRQVNEVTRIKSLFLWAFDMEYLTKRMNYGRDFVKPEKGVLRAHRLANGKRLFTAEELRTVIRKAPIPMRAWFLLGINAAFYAKDIADLPIDAVDLDNGWLDFPRKKTTIPRKAKLWRETVKALREALEERPKPTAEAEGLFFLTPNGKPWRADRIGRIATTCIKEAGLPENLKFHWLRHTFRTIADATLDRVATRLVMGHSDPSIDAVYTEDIDDARLVKVAEHVRNWLFPGEKGGPTDG